MLVLYKGFAFIFVTLFKSAFLYFASKIICNCLVEVCKCSDSNTSSAYELIKYYMGVILPVFKYLNSYTPKSIIGAMDASNGPSPPSMICL